jgi:UDP-N-acetylglucosamine transferase subunit ALG13
MIFLTVGNELPFPRLVEAVDRWCAVHPEEKVFGQIGPSSSDGVLPANFPWVEFVAPEVYHQKFQEAELIIGHAGIGTIISALSLSKPVMIMPRLAARREHRNDHQLATAERFSKRKGVFVAEDEIALLAALGQRQDLFGKFLLEPLCPFADDRLIDTIRTFIFQEQKQNQ